MNTKPGINDMPEIGKTIRRLRKAYNLSLGDLSGQSGVSKSIISQIERNETNPTLGTIVRLSNALNTTPEHVVGNKKNTVHIDILSKNATPVIKSEDGLCSLKIIGAIDTVTWVQWYEFHAEPGGVLDSDGHQSGSTEHATVIGGTLDVNILDVKKRAYPGETIRYRCDIRHVLSNNGNTPLHVLMVLILKPTRSH